MTLQAVFFARRHLAKLILDRLLMQLNGLMIYNKIERVLVITKCISNYYNTNLSLEITAKVQKLIRNIHLHTNWPPNATFRCHLYFFTQPSRNGMHRIVGYQRQRRIHLCCLLKSIRWRYLMRQEVKLTLDSGVHWSLPTLECCLRREHFSVFGCSHNHRQPRPPDPNQLTWVLITATFHHSAWAPYQHTPPPQSLSGIELSMCTYLTLNSFSLPARCSCDYLQYSSAPMLHRLLIPSISAWPGKKERNHHSVKTQ